VVQSSKGVTVVEPLALLAAADYFATETTWSLQHFLSDSLSSPNILVQSLAFNPFGAYLFCLAFKTPRPLYTVFNFVVPDDLQNKEAELVALQKIDGQFVASSVDICSNKTPAYTLGRHCTSKETSAWLEDPQKIALCFPAKPDLIFHLRLRGDGSHDEIVRVFVEFKLTTTKSMTPDDTKQSFDRTNPMYALSLFPLC
jgi:hypothetical protein